jgi:acyl-CoA thioester hydrolase
MINKVHEIKLQIRYRDIDSLGHVNNAVFLSYFEIGRIGLFRLNTDEYSVDSINFVIAHMEIDFLRTLHLFDEVILRTTIVKVGRTSFTFDHVILSEHGKEVYTHGTAVAVAMKDGEKVPVPQFIKDLLAE